MLHRVGVPMSPDAYFVTVDGKQLGPFKGQQVRTKLAQGKIAHSDYVWKEGMADWVQISSILHDLPGVEPPPPPETESLRTVTITHPEGFAPTEISIPPKGVYEPAATLKQKNLLMKLGWENPDFLKHLGRDQASYMIDALKTDYENLLREKARRTNRITAAILLILILVSVVTVALWKNFAPSISSRKTTGEGNVSETSITQSQLPTTATVKVTVHAQTPRGEIIIPAGTKVRVVYRYGTSVQVSYLGWTSSIPLSATDLK